MVDRILRALPSLLGPTAPMALSPPTTYPPPGQGTLEPTGDLLPSCCGSKRKEALLGSSPAALHRGPSHPI